MSWQVRPNSSAFRPPSQNFCILLNRPSAPFGASHSVSPDPITHTMGTMAGVDLALRVVAFGRQPFGHCKPVAGRSQWAFSLASAILIEMDDTNTVKCPLCGVDVPIDKIDLPNRCLHPQCPLKRPRSLQSLSTSRALHKWLYKLRS